MREVHFQKEIAQQKKDWEIHQDDENFFKKENNSKFNEMILRNTLVKWRVLRNIWNIKLDSSKQVLEALEEIFESIHDKILYWEYWLIIWDDASARMPANIVRRTINDIHKKLWYKSTNIGYIKWRICNKEVLIKNTNWSQNKMPTKKYLNYYLDKLNTD